MTRRRSVRRVLIAALILSTPACDRSVEGSASPGPGAAIPRSAAELAALVVTPVASGLPRVPDDQVRPPAGAKTVEDVAAYADDPQRERGVLAEYG